MKHCVQNILYIPGTWYVQEGIQQCSICTQARSRRPPWPPCPFVRFDSAAVREPAVSRARVSSYCSNSRHAAHLENFVKLELRTFWSVASYHDSSDEICAKMEATKNRIRKKGAPRHAKGNQENRATANTNKEGMKDGAG